MKARKIIIPVFVPHLGCPHDCVFCNQNRIAGTEKPAEAADVIKAIEAAEPLIDADAHRQLAFYGGSFTAIPLHQQEELLSAAQNMIFSGKIDSIRLSTRPDAINTQVLDRLKLYGVETVEIGAQSMDDKVLQMSGRGHTSSDVVTAAELIKKAGFQLILQMMTGLPGDSIDKARNTAMKLAELMPDGVRIYPTVVVRDTALFELWSSGRYTEHSVEDAVKYCAEIVPIFDNKGIPIIRLGLNPTEELSNGAAAAGAYHPAMGELVRSRIMRNKALKLLLEVPTGSQVILGVRNTRISQMTGQHRCNVKYLMDTLGLKSVKVVPADAEHDEIKVIKIY